MRMHFSAKQQGKMQYPLELRPARWHDIAGPNSKPLGHRATQSDLAAASLAVNVKHAARHPDPSSDMCLPDLDIGRDHRVVERNPGVPFA